MQHFGVRGDLQENYDRYYSPRDTAWRELCARYKAANIVALCGRIQPATLVDIGAGDGSVSAALATSRFGAEIHCLEISSSAIDAIRLRAIPRVSGVTQFDGYHVDFPDKHFDLGIASHVLEHVEHERAFLSEAGRVCKYLFVEVPLEDTLRLSRDYRPSSIGHINFYSYKTLRRLLQTCGFEVIEQRLFDIPLAVHRFESGWRGVAKFAVRKPFAMISKRLGSKFFTYHCAVLCACP